MEQTAHYKGGEFSFVKESLMTLGGYFFSNIEREPTMKVWEFRKLILDSSRLDEYGKAVMSDHFEDVIDYHTRWGIIRREKNTLTFNLDNLMLKLRFHHLEAGPNG